MFFPLYNYDSCNALKVLDIIPISNDAILFCLVGDIHDLCRIISVQLCKIE